MPPTPTSTPFPGTGWLRAALLASGALLVSCCAHAALAAPAGPLDPLEGAAELSRAFALGSPALAGPEDLRHPGRARLEMPLGGQPALVDPRPAALLVRPVPVRVVRP